MSLLESQQELNADKEESTEGADEEESPAKVPFVRRHPMKDLFCDD